MANVCAKMNILERSYQSLDSSFHQKNTAKGRGGGGGGGTKTKPHPKIQQTCSYTTEDRFKGLMQLRVERTAHQLLHSLRVLDSVRKDVTP